MAPVLDARFVTLTIKKEAVGAPGQTWQNSYEIDFGFENSVGSYENASLLADAFLEAEQGIHLENVRFLEVEIRTWAEDTPTHDPESFIVFEYSVLGSRTSDSDPEPRGLVLWAGRDSITGRAGKLFYRGCLSEGDIVAGDSLNPVMQPASVAAFQGYLDDAYEAMETFLQDLFIEATMSLVSIYHFAQLSRPIIEFVLRGATYCKPKHKWFNRTTT